MNILDIGFGRGYFTFPLAEALNNTGSIFATEIEPKMIEYINRDIKKSKYKNICPILVTSEGLDPFYKEHIFDIIFICEIVPCLRDYENYFQELRTSLAKERGRLYIIEMKTIADFHEFDFGDYKEAHVSLTGTAVAEGDSGLTEVQVTVNLTESFGAPITIYYHTEDGTAEDGFDDILPGVPDPTEDQDYVAVTAGQFTINPQGLLPTSSWDVTSLTGNKYNDYDYDISGDRIVWEAFNGTDWEAWFVDLDDPSTDTETCSQSPELVRSDCGGGEAVPADNLTAAGFLVVDFTKQSGA